MAFLSTWAQKEEMGILLLESPISMRKAPVNGQKSAKAAPVPRWGRGRTATAGLFPGTNLGKQAGLGRF